MTMDLRVEKKRLPELSAELIKECNTSEHNSSMALELESTTSKSESDQSNGLDDILSNLKLGLFHWKVLALVGWGYFAVCSEMMLFIFLSSPVKKEWNLDDMDFPWLPFRLIF